MTPLSISEDCLLRRWKVSALLLSVRLNVSSFFSHVKPKEGGSRITVFYLLCSRGRNEVMLVLLSFLFESAAFEGARKSGLCSIRRSHRWSIFRGATFTESCKEAAHVARSEGGDGCSGLEGPVLGRCQRFKRKKMFVSKLTLSQKRNGVQNDHCLMLLLCLTMIKYVVQEYQVWSAAELGLIEVHCRWRVNERFPTAMQLGLIWDFLLWVTKEQYIFLPTFCVCEIWYARWDRQESTTSLGQLSGRRG